MGRNVADEASIKEAERKEKREREEEISDIVFLLEQPQGRRFIWRLLGKARVFASIWEPSAKIHYNAGQQDFGHFLLDEVVKNKPDALLQMMQESKKREEENG